MKIDFNSQERLLLLDALIYKPYLKKVNQKQTPAEVVAIYEGLKKKLATKEVEATEGRPVQAIETLRKEIKFINFKLPEMNAKEKGAGAEFIIDLERAISYLEEL